MSENPENCLEVLKENMEQAISHLEKELLKIRAGKANPSMISNLKVDYYGTLTPVSQVGAVNTPDAQTISIQPWEKGLLPEIEKAIRESNLGFNPMNNGDVIIINVPPLTEERRKELTKNVKEESENAKISARNARKNANATIKKMEISEDEKSNWEVDIQEMTDKYIVKIDNICKSKEQEIMTI